MSRPIDGSDGYDLGPVSREGNAPGARAVLEVGLQTNDVKPCRRATYLAKPHGIHMARLRPYVDHGAAATYAWLRAGMANLLTAVPIINEQIKVGVRMPVKLRGGALAPPGGQQIARLAGPLFMEPIGSRAKQAGPVPLGRVARAGKAKEVSRMSPIPQNTAERGVDFAAALTVTPIRRDY